MSTNKGNKIKTATPAVQDDLQAENEALKAKLAALEAENQKLKAPVNSSAGTKPAVERVAIHVPRGNSKDEPNLLISVNGVNYLLPKGKTSNVPKFVADEYHRAMRAQGIQDDHIEEMKTN